VRAAYVHGGCSVRYKRKKIAMDGLCDVPGCKGVVFLGWRPLTAKHGRQVCEEHWRRHKNSQDGFDLFEAFGFKKPDRMGRLVSNEDIA